MIPNKSVSRAHAAQDSLLCASFQLPVIEMLVFTRNKNGEFWRMVESKIKQFDFTIIE
jgi:hypothetical protein